MSLKKRLDALREASAGRIPADARAVTDILPDTVGRLAEHENIVAIKDATADMQRMREQVAAAGEDFLYFSGDDFTILDFIREGGHGVVTVSGNVAPAAVAKLCKLASEDEFEAAEELDVTLQPLNTALFVESNPIPVKWALHQMGLIGEGIRLPLTPHAPEFHSQMLEALATAGIELPGRT